MIQLYVLLGASCLLAWLSEQYQTQCEAEGIPYRLRRDKAYLLLLGILILFSGLRTRYNDTTHYLSAFRQAPGLLEFFEDPENLNIFRNPLFYAYQSLLHTWFDNGQILIFTSACFTQACFLQFFKRYSKSFRFSVFVYITLGTFCFSMAALKQVVAMAILTLALPFLQERKYGRFYLLVFLAMLFHTYALIYSFLPLFIGKPWKPFTYLFLLATIIILVNFQDAISSFMDQANELGKTLSEEEIFDNQSVNTFRLMVYMVLPLISLFFQRWLFYDSHKMDHVWVHMSIISMSFMILGTESGANMFGRMANYFELGTICCMPWVLKKIFNRPSYLLVRRLAVVCFLGYFTYAYGISMDFSANYSAMSLFQFIRTLF